MDTSDNLLGLHYVAGISNVYKQCQSIDESQALTTIVGLLMMHSLSDHKWVTDVHESLSSDQSPGFRELIRNGYLITNALLQEQAIPAKQYIRTMIAYGYYQTIDDPTGLGFVSFVRSIVSFCCNIPTTTIEWLCNQLDWNYNDPQVVSTLDSLQKATKEDMIITKLGMN